MVRFSAAEESYLAGHDLGRVATAGANCQPHVTPVNYEFAPGTSVIVLPGLDAGSKKFRDLQQNNRVGFVVDDLPDDDAESPRGVCIRGYAEIFKVGGEFHQDGFGGGWLRIVPERVVSWGLDEQTGDEPSKQRQVELVS